MSTSGQRRRHHKVVIVGGGGVGVSVAARLLGAGETDVAVVGPATTHYYQPLSEDRCRGTDRSAGRSGRCSGCAASPGRALRRSSETPLEGLAEGWAPGVRLVVEAAVGLDLSLQTGS